MAVKNEKHVAVIRAMGVDEKTFFSKMDGFLADAMEARKTQLEGNPTPEELAQILKSALAAAIRAGQGWFETTVGPLVNPQLVAAGFLEAIEEWKGSSPGYNKHHAGLA